MAGYYISRQFFFLIYGKNRFGRNSILVAFADIVHETLNQRKKIARMARDRSLTVIIRKIIIFTAARHDKRWNALQCVFIYYIL